MRFFVTICIITPLFFWGCKKHEQPELTDVNIDCDCASEVSADFEILELEILPQFDPVGTDSDTIFHNSNVLFKAKEEGAEYTWYIGANVYNTQEVGLNFPEVFGGQDITVSLVVNKPTNAICFPNDDGVDSVSRTFYVQTYGVCDLTSEFVSDTTLMEGTFRVKSDHLVDSFDMTIDYIDESFNEKIHFFNYDGLGSNIQTVPRCSVTLKTYRGIWVESQGTFNNCFQGEFFYQLDGTALFNVTLCENVGGTWVYTDYTYTGRKL